MKKYLPLFLIVLIITLCLQIGCDKDEPIISGLPVIVAPAQITPANGAVIYSDSITFTWRKVIGVTGYTLQIALDSNFFSGYIYYQGELSDTSKQIIFFTNPHAYFWRVNSVLYNTVTPWSPVRRFTKVVIMNTPCPGTPTVSYAGKIYNTVQIGSQCWLKENLNIGIMIQGTDTAKNNGIIEKYCYDNDTNNCNTYGGLYQWNEAMQYTTTPGTNGICPSGWHIPTKAEYETLIAAVDSNSNALKAEGQGSGAGSGTNTSGFSALLAGYRSFSGGTFGHLGQFTYFWSSSELSAYGTYYMYLFYYNSSINYNDGAYEEYGFSLRCVKD